MQVIPSIDLKAGRSRLVFWPGAATGTGTPTDRPERIARHFVELGAPAIHLVDLDGAAAGRPVNTAAVQAIARAVATPLQLAGGVDGPEQIELAFAAGATRVVLPLLAVAEDPERLAACLRIAGDWLAVGPGRAAGALRGGRLEERPAADARRRSWASWPAAGVRRFVLSHGGARPDLDAAGGPHRAIRCRIRARRRCHRRRPTGGHPGCRRPSHPPRRGPARWRRRLPGRAGRGRLTRPKHDREPMIIVRPRTVGAPRGRRPRPRRLRCPGAASPSVDRAARRRRTRRSCRQRHAATA